MFLILRQLCENLQKFDDEYRDRRSEQYPFRGFMPLIALLVSYYTFVKILGPKLMEKRKPFELKYVILVYNVLQIITCGYVVVRAIYGWLVQDPYKNYSCMMPIVDNSSIGLLEMHLVYCYYLLKILDFMDTIFFVLRKRKRQVTFLHVYHHILACFGAFLGTRYLPGGHGAVLGLVNCFVHTLMYSYYFLSALRPEMRDSLWWKKYLTQVQVVQFLLVGLHYARALFNADCNYPKTISAFIVIQSVVMTALFSDFYYKSYIRRSKKVQAK